MSDRRAKLRRWVVAAFTLLGGAAAVGGTGEEWRYGQFQSTISARVLSLTLSPDTGQGRKLVTPMSAIFAGAAGPTYVGSWDGNEWGGVPGSIPDPGFQVGACDYHNGELWVAGFSADGSSIPPIRRWNGSQWVSVQVGLFSSPGSAPWMMRSAGGIMYLSGQYFVGTGGTRLIRFSGGLWQSAGLGLASLPADMITVGNELWVAGEITSGAGQPTSVARAVGGVWDATGGGPPIRITQLVNAADGVVAGGYTAGNQAGAVFQRVGGAWNKLGADLPGMVMAVTEHDGVLIALHRQGTDAVYGLTRWNGTAWEPWNTLQGLSWNGYAPTDARLYSYSGELLLMSTNNGRVLLTGGSEMPFKLAAGYSAHRGWRTLVEELPEAVARIVVSDGERLLMTLDGEPRTNPPAGYNSVLTLEPGAMQWTNAQGVFKSQLINDALRIDGETLLAASREIAYGLDRPVGVVRWNGSRSSAMGNGLLGLQGSLSNGLRTATAGALRLVQVRGRLYTALVASGQGDQPALHEWDGARWNAIGQFNGEVRDMCAWRGMLVAAGDFTAVGALEGSRVAVFDGAKWIAAGAGVDGRVRAVASYNGDLYVAGEFANAGGVPAPGIARWDGNAWYAVGAPMTGENGFLSISGLRVYAGELFATGNMSGAGGTPLGRIARWNGDSWRPVGQTGAPGLGFIQTPKWMTTHDGELYVGGPIGYVGGAWSGPFARWHQSARAQITQQPAAVTVAAGGQAGFTVGGDAGTFRWRRSLTGTSGWTDLLDGVQSGGSVAAGCATAHLTISGVGAGDAAYYQCRVENGAGAVFTSPARLTIVP